MLVAVTNSLQQQPRRHASEFSGGLTNLPTGVYNRLSILAGDQAAEFRVGDKTTNVNIQDWSGFFCQRGTCIWKNTPERNRAISANRAICLQPMRSSENNVHRLQDIPTTTPIWRWVMSSPRASFGNLASSHRQWTQPAIPILLSLRILH